MNNDGIRVRSDLRNEKIGYKIREHTIARVSYMVIVGDKEMSDETLSVRTLDGSQAMEMDLQAFSAHLQKECSTKRREQLG